MSSILTNTSAMVALQTLNSVNKSLSTTQGEISTGKSVATAKDNASVWAIAQTMQSDVDGFNGISDSLATGSASVAVARTAAETITGLLGQVKEKVVAAQDNAADTSKLQDDIDELVEQVGSVVSAAQFNGLNLVDSTGSIQVLGSLDHDSSGNVSASSITVDRQDLSIGVASEVANAFTGSSGASTNNGNFATAIDDAGTATIAFSSTNADFAVGDKLTVSIGDQSTTYTVKDSDVAAGNSVNETIAVGVADAITAMGITGVDMTVASGSITFTNNTGEAISLAGNSLSAGSGGLGALSNIDVTTGAAAALSSIEGLISTAIDAAAAFGSAEMRLETQSEFVSKLTDSLKEGIGALVDADMEETSARLQALQVQQQLGIQSLSIANQQPQNVLQLFR